jgi:chemotaxis family two-component system response regulator Rcp1
LRREGEYAHTSRPDLILLDLNLPKTDGRVVLQALRATPEWKSIPIMILTGVLQDADQQQAAALEVERFLRKPVDLQEYLALADDLTAWWEIRKRSSRK